MPQPSSIDQVAPGLRTRRARPAVAPRLAAGAAADSPIARCTAVASHGRRCRGTPAAGSPLCVAHLRQAVRAAQARARAGSGVAGGR